MNWRACSTGLLYLAPLHANCQSLFLNNGRQKKGLTELQSVTKWTVSKYITYDRMQLELLTFSAKTTWLLEYNSNLEGKSRNKRNTTSITACRAVFIEPRAQGENRSWSPSFPFFCLKTIFKKNYKKAYFPSSWAPFSLGPLAAARAAR